MKTKTILPAHLFVSSCDGALYNTSQANWSANPVRKNYRRTHKEIKTVADLKATLRNGAFTFPGCYPLYFFTRDGCALSFKTVQEEFRSIAKAIQGKDRFSGWRVVGCDVNWEDSDLRCEHSGDKIESAYGDAE